MRPPRGDLGGPRLRLLFLCTGNTCRSPMAEVLARAEAKWRGWTHVRCASAGTSAWRGQSAAREGQIVARLRGLDLSDHASRPLTPELLEKVDLVLGMGPEHLETVRELRPGVPVRLLSSYLPQDHPRHGEPIPDPVGGSVAVYEETADVLEAAVRGLFDRLADEGTAVPHSPDDGRDPA